MKSKLQFLQFAAIHVLLIVTSHGKQLLPTMASCCRAGIACIVPPAGWSPPFALSKGTNGLSADSFRFSIRRQPTWQLCMRSPNPKSSMRGAAAAGR